MRVMSNNTTLVTGAAGFIGAHVANALAGRGNHIIGIDNFDPYYDVKLKHDRVRWVESASEGRCDFRTVDFADAVALENILANDEIDRIVHLGAQPGVRYSLENPCAYARANIVGHLNLLEFARKRRVAHMVYASSSSVYGRNEKLPFSVDDRTDHPVSLYAATKRADELISEAYAHLYRIPLTGLRFFTVYGPWGRPDMMPWIFTSRILARKPIKVFNYGKLKRDFTYIDDIVAGVISVHDAPPKDTGKEKPGGSKAPHSIYNIGNNKSESLLDVIKILEKACGRRARVEMLEMQPGDVKRTFADISAISRDLCYAPSTSVETGLPKFVEWYRSYKKL